MFLLSFPHKEYDIDLQIPFLPEEKFTGRKDMLSKVCSILQVASSDYPQKVSRSVIVLHGLGGIGKTTIATHLAYSRQHVYSGIFWLRAKTRESLATSAMDMLNRLIAHYSKRYIGAKLDFQSISSELEIPGLLDQYGSPVKELLGRVWEVVAAWIARRENSGWLLVVDGADDDNIDLAEILPKCTHGHVLVTSRVRGVAYTIGGKVLDVEPMGSVDAVELLVKGTGKDLSDLNDEGAYRG